MKQIKTLSLLASLVLLSGCVAPLTNQDLIKEFDDTDFTVTETDRGLVVFVPMVFFEFGSDELTLPAREKLEEVSEILTRSSTNSRKLSIEGHTDDVGEDAYNLALSQRRATNVMEILAFSGIQRNRMVSQGLGEAQPTVPNFNEDGSPNEANRSKNRRVELVILNI